MKVGDLVKFQSLLNNDVFGVNISGDDTKDHEIGLVLAMSKTGHDTESAQVLFSDGETWWVGTHRLEVVNENRTVS